MRVEQPGQVYFEGKRLQTEQRGLVVVEGCVIGNLIVGDIDIQALVTSSIYGNLWNAGKPRTVYPSAFAIFIISRQKR